MLRRADGAPPADRTVVKSPATYAMSPTTSTVRTIPSVPHDAAGSAGRVSTATTGGGDGGCGDADGGRGCSVTPETAVTVLEHAASTTMPTSNGTNTRGTAPPSPRSAPRPAARRRRELSDSTDRPSAGTIAGRIAPLTGAQHALDAMPDIDYSRCVTREPGSVPVGRGRA